jgi:hypothetical protein
VAQAEAPQLPEQAGGEVVPAPEVAHRTDVPPNEAPE